MTTDTDGAKLALFDETIQALEWVLPLAERYLHKAPSHPDNAKLESARAVLAKVKEISNA